MQRVSTPNYRDSRLVFRRLGTPKLTVAEGGTVISISFPISQDKSQKSKWQLFARQIHGRILNGVFTRNIPSASAWVVPRTNRQTVRELPRRTNGRRVRNSVDSKLQSSG